MKDDSTYDELNSPPPAVIFGSHVFHDELFADSVYPLNLEFQNDPGWSTEWKLYPFAHFNVAERTGLNVRYVILNCGPVRVGEPIQLSPLHWVAGLRSRLKGLADLQDDWDSEGSRAPSVLSVGLASIALETFVSYAIKSSLRNEPAVTVMPDGAIRFELSNKDKELFLTITDGRVEAQRWQPISAVESIYYQEIPFNRMRKELEWLGA